MLKTNSKKALENAKAAFNDLLADYSDDFTEAGALEAMIDNLIAGSTNSEGRLYTPEYKTIQDAFTYCIIADFFPYTEQARKELASILEETEEEAAGFSSDKVYKTLGAVMYKQFIAKCEELGKNIYNRYRY